MSPWWAVLCVAVIWNTTSSHPTFDNGQQQTECCPCPKDDSFARFGDADTMASDQVAFGTADGSRAVAGMLEDCPCRFRDADSVGSPSVFFPNAVRAVRPFLSSDNSKENPDPLLHPEVNLASSVLQTLHKATDEEYREALARDAARSISDGLAAETGNLVTVLINPKDVATSDDDVMAEASHAHEARCISPPLGRSSLRKSAHKPSILLTDILKLPKWKPASARSWNLFDMDSGVGASSVSERVVKPDSKENEQSSVLNLSSNSKSKRPLDLSFRMPAFSSNLPNARSRFNSGSSIFPKHKTQSKIEIPRIPNLSTRWNTQRENENHVSGSSDAQRAASAQAKIVFPSISIPKFNTPSLARRNEDEDSDFGSDSQNAASLIKERYTGFERDDSQDEDFKATTLRPIFKSSTGFNFGDKLDLSSLKINPFERRDASTDFLNGIIKGLEVPNLNNMFASDIFNLRNNDDVTKSSEIEEIVEIIPKKKSFVTEILDTVPSPSEIKSDHVSFDEVESDGGVNVNMNTEDEDIQNIIEQNPMKTEILDHLPKFTDKNQVKELQTNIFNDADVEAKTNSNGDNSELNNEMDEINKEDIVEDSIISESDRNRQIQETNFLKDSAEQTDISSDLTEITDNIENSEIKDAEENEALVENNTNSPASTLRESIRNTLENLKKRSKINLESLKVNNNDKSTLSPDKDLDLGSTEDPIASETVNTESDNVSTQILDSMPSKEIIDQVDIKDLQEMSDSLLNEEKERINSLAVEDAEKNMKTDEMSGTIDSATQETNNVGDVTQTIDKKDIVCFDVPSSKISTSDSRKLNIKNDEMESDASERVSDTIYLDDRVQSPLRQNIILQPPSLNDLNLGNLPKLDLSDVLNINKPALKLPSIFNARDNDDDMSSMQDDLDTKQQSMSASTSSFKSVLPPIKRLEDINLDILQLKPLGSSIPSVPRLNLNSFKSRLAIPDSLQMKPLLLESSVGNKKGVIGASITLGSDKNEFGRSNMLQEASLKKPSFLGSPLVTLPSLDDLHNAMWENTQNLLSTPLKTTGRNVVEDTLRSGQVLTENLRVEAKNTMKDIQRNFESTLKGVGLNNHGLLSSNSFRSPNLLEEISRRHEDVNDKLKGIHYDLSDRLETWRNNILDEYRIPSLGSSIFDGLPTLGSSTPKQSFLKPKSKSSTKSKKVTLSSSSGTKGRFISRSSNDKNKLKMPTASSTKTFKTIKSPSFRNKESPVLKALGKESTKPQLFSRNRPSLSILPKTEKNVIETSRPLLKKPSLPIFNKSKVKISFSTTELPPILKSSRFKEVTKPKSAITLPSLSRSPSRDRTGLLSSFKDSSGYASEPIASRVKAPAMGKKNIKEALRSSIRPKIATMDIDDKEYEENLDVTTTEKPKIDSSSPTKPKPPMLNKVYKNNAGQTNAEASLKPKAPLISDGTIDKVVSEPATSSPRVAALSWPKTIDDKFLVKVREALRARLAGIGQGLVSANSKLGDSLKIGDFKSDLVKPGDVDMARSASDNVVVVEGSGAMKENVAYSCKMMCTKN